VIDKNVDALAKFADRHVVLEKGRVVWRGTQRRSAQRQRRQGPLSAFVNGRPAMKPLTAGVTKANEGIDAISWNILGQTYVPKTLSEDSFSWHATFPPGTFVPPHIHPTQDEFIYMLEGRLDLVLDGQESVATAGDLIRLPRNQPHGLFNKSDATVKCLFWVAPTGSALRSVLGDPFDAAAEPGRGRGALGEIRDRLPAASARRRGVS
jgi:mannose-6-phosphate isomerase-like protein (cupin superfamily)